jgi:hypothetical protein
VQALVFVNGWKPDEGQSIQQLLESEVFADSLVPAWDWGLGQREPLGGRLDAGHEAFTPLAHRCAYWRSCIVLARKISPDTERGEFAASVLPCAAYEFVRVRSRRAFVTACPYPSLLK